MSAMTRRTPQEIALDYARRSEAALRRAMFASHPHRAEARRAMTMLRNAAGQEHEPRVREALQHAAAKVEHALFLCGKPDVTPLPEAVLSLYNGEE